MSVTSFAYDMEPVPLATKRIEKSVARYPDARQAAAMYLVLVQLWHHAPETHLGSQPFCYG